MKYDVVNEELDITKYSQQNNQAVIKMLPLSKGHGWCMALQLLFEQNLTLILTGRKIHGVIMYEESCCP